MSENIDLDVHSGLMTDTLKRHPSFEKKMLRMSDLKKSIELIGREDIFLTPFNNNIYTQHYYNQKTLNISINTRIAWINYYIIYSQTSFKEEYEVKKIIRVEIASLIK